MNFDHERHERERPDIDRSARERPERQASEHHSADREVAEHEESGTGAKNESAMVETKVDESNTNKPVEEDAQGQEEGPEKQEEELHTETAPLSEQFASTDDNIIMQYLTSKSPSHSSYSSDGKSATIGIDFKIGDFFDKIVDAVRSVFTTSHDGSDADTPGQKTSAGSGSESNPGSQPESKRVPQTEATPPNLRRETGTRDETGQRNRSPETRNQGSQGGGVQTDDTGSGHTSSQPGGDSTKSSSGGAGNVSTTTKNNPDYDGLKKDIAQVRAAASAVKTTTKVTKWLQDGTNTTKSYTADIANANKMFGKLATGIGRVFGAANLVNDMTKYHAAVKAHGEESVQAQAAFRAITTDVLKLAISSGPAKIVVGPVLDEIEKYIQGRELSSAVFSKDADICSVFDGMPSILDRLQSKDPSLNRDPNAPEIGLPGPEQEQKDYEPGRALIETGSLLGTMVMDSVNDKVADLKADLANVLATVSDPASYQRNYP